jgi:hypothetical protein
MTPKQEVAGLAECRKLNKRFEPPKNPAWWWSKYAGGWHVRSIVAILAGPDDVPGWTLADLLELTRREKIPVHCGWTQDGNTGESYPIVGIGMEPGARFTATNLARAILRQGCKAKGAKS